MRSAVTLAEALASFWLVDRPIRSGALRRMGLWVPRVVAPVAVVLGAAVLVAPVVAARPPAPEAGMTGGDVLASRFARLAARFPGRVEVLDVNRFIRDRSGAYQMWMPCVVTGEPGCNKGVVQVRLALDGGNHFCTATDHGTPTVGPCPPKDARRVRRVRRVAAGFAAALVPALDALRAPGGNATPSTAPAG